MMMEGGSSRGSPSYYAVLGISPDSSSDDIRRAYRKLAMQWHPDRWARNPSLLGEAKCKFQQIQEAYEVLSDPRKRTLYDAGMYDAEDDVDEEFSDFVQEMVSLMAQARTQEKSYSMEELQNMFLEMAEGFEFSAWSSSFNDPEISGGTRWDLGMESSEPRLCTSGGFDFSAWSSSFNDPEISRGTRWDLGMESS